MLLDAKALHLEIRFALRLYGTDHRRFGVGREIFDSLLRRLHVLDLSLESHASSPLLVKLILEFLLRHLCVVRESRLFLCLDGGVSSQRGLF